MPPDAIIQPPATETPAAPVAPSLDERIGALSGAARDHWQLNGDLLAAESMQSGAPAPQVPAKTESDVKTESSTVEKPEASTDAQTAPESGPGEIKSNESQSERNWKEVRKQLSAAERENIALLAKLELLEKGELRLKPESAPAAAKTETAFNERPEFPDIEQFETIAKWKDAIKQWQKADAAWVQAQTDNRISAYQKQQSEARVAETLEAQFKQGRTKYKDFDQVAFRSDVPVSDAMLKEIRARGDGWELLYHFGKNPELAVELAKRSHVDPHSDPVQDAYQRGSVEALVRLELDRIASEIQKTRQLPAKPPALPKPTNEVTVNANSTPVGDELADAIARGDQAAYARIMNKREAESWKAGVH